MVEAWIEHTFLQRCRDYLAGTLHLPASLEQCAPPAALPVFLAHDYRYFAGTIAKRGVLIMVGGGNTPPASLARHREQVAAETDQLIIIGAEYMPSTTRARLIDNAIPFIVPDNQFYAPHLGMDLREDFLLPPKRPQRLTPAAQAILFHYLLGHLDRTASSHEIAECSGYSPMSISRAADELTALELATTAPEGRARPLVFDADKAALFKRAKPFFATPVRGRHAVTFTKGWPAMLEAGELALSRKSELNRPALPVFAIPAKDWQRFFVNHGIMSHNYEHEGEAIIETWRYDPHALIPTRGGPEGSVDALSLYASLADHKDERVQLALDEMLEEHVW